jgi:SnoaL-like domain
MNPMPKRTALRSLLALPLGALGLAAMSRRTPAAERAPRAGLQALAARQANTEAREQVTEVLHRYARGWDREDEDSIRDCFWPESTHQHGAFKGLSHDFVAASYKATRNVKLMSHMITNVSIEVAGSRALSECYFFALHRRASKTGPGNVDWILKGRYIDRFERRGDTWKIAQRRGVHDFSRTFDPADTSLDAAPAEQLSGNKATDPYYSMLAELRAGR